MSNDLIVIVVVEDDPDDQYLIQKALAAVEFKLDVMFIGNGLEAQRFFESEQPKASISKSLVLLDLNLPGASGIEVLKSIKSDPDYHPLPVVILTTSDFDAEKDTAKALGASDYIVKPDDIDRFKDVLSRVIHSHVYNGDPNDQ